MRTGVSSLYYQQKITTMSLTILYQSLFQRKRPEDIADTILTALSKDLSAHEYRLISKAAQGSLKRRFFGYTSMLQEFARPINLETQIQKTIVLFGLEKSNTINYNNIGQIENFIKETSKLIGKSFGENNFIADRLNKFERKALGFDISKRQYNKKWRLLKRLENKLLKFIREQRKSEFQQIGKHGLARRIKQKDFEQDINTACFIAYYTAKSNLRSEFTISGQQRAFDEISNVLYKRCLKHSHQSNWWAIAHVYPNAKTLGFLSDTEKGNLLGQWTKVLEDIAQLLGETWRENKFNRKTMVVQRGNDSSTWNNTANAWNKAREHWIALVYALDMEYILDNFCFGKVMRLMAADVVRWHKVTGGGLDPNTFVWNVLPLPWEVFSGKKNCTRQMIEQACVNASISPTQSGWVAPRIQQVVTFKPTPELVHGVAIACPFFATILKKKGYFSGKKIKNSA